MCNINENKLRPLDVLFTRLLIRNWIFQTRSRFAYAFTNFTLSLNLIKSEGTPWATINKTLYKNLIEFCNIWKSIQSLYSMTSFHMSSIVLSCIFFSFFYFRFGQTKSFAKCNWSENKRTIMGSKVRMRYFSEFELIPKRVTTLR